MSQEEFYMNRLEKLAFFLGAAAVPSIFIFPVVMPFLLASMSIVFAVMSKGGNLHFSRRAKWAAAMAVLAIVMNLIYIGYTFQTLYSLLSSQSGRQELSDLLYQQYGITLEEFLSQFPALQ